MRARGEEADSFGGAAMTGSPDDDEALLTENRLHKAALAARLTLPLLARLEHAFFRFSHVPVRPEGIPAGETHSNRAG